MILTATMLLLLGAAQGSTDDPARSDAIRRARESLGRELGVEPETLVLRDARAVEWNDSSLGCPEKGMRYLAVLTPGYRVVLDSAGRSHVMHVAERRVVSCASGADAAAAEKREAAALVARLLAEARRDLAQRLGVPDEEVKLVALRRALWPDAGLGCPRPGEPYAKVQTEGWDIELQVAEARYRYHSDRQRAVYCPDPRTP